MSKKPILPLCGMRVLGFTHAVMGPTAGLILADLGAEVIHIEPPAGDQTRRLKGFGTGYFPFYSRNKKSLAVDLKSDAGREIIAQLIPTADIVVENYGPGTMERLGYGYEAMRALTEGEVPPMPARLSAWSIYRIFETKDDESLFVGVTSDRHWEAFCQVLNQAGNKGLLPTTLPDGTCTRLPRLPLEMGDYNFGLRHDPPPISADTDALLTEIGYSADDIKRLRDAGEIA